MSNSLIVAGVTLIAIGVAVAAAAWLALLNEYQIGLRIGFACGLAEGERRWRPAIRKL